MATISGYRKYILESKLNLITGALSENGFILKTSCGKEVFLNTEKLTKKQNGLKSRNFIYMKEKLFIVAGIGKPCKDSNSNNEESIFLLEEGSQGVCCWDAVSFQQLEKRYDAKKV